MKLNFISTALRGVNMDREQIDRDMRQFVREIYNCRTKEETIEINKRLDAYYMENDVPEELNHVLNDGVGEMLEMLSTS